MPAKKRKRENEYCEFLVIKLTKLKMVTNDIDINVVPFVSTEQNPTSVSVVTDLNFSIQSNKVEMFYHSSPSVDLVL